MLRVACAASMVVCLLAGGGGNVAHAATIRIVVGDAPGEGFNDPTPASPIGGNPGTTVGEQRLKVFERAAAIWGAALDSAVEIRVLARFDQLACSASTGTLGQAGPARILAEFPGAALADTWYPIALANRLAFQDLLPTLDDINATFNSAIGNDNCLEGNGWYYGLDHLNASSTIDLLAVVLHELGHGLGFTSSVGQLGDFPGGRPDVFSRQMFDETFGRPFDQLTSSERLDAQLNGYRVSFRGPRATAAAATLLSAGAVVLEIDGLPGGASGSFLAGVPRGFGPAFTATGVTGELAAATPADACSAVSGVSGKIALVNRTGACDFDDRVRRAQAAGAIGVVIASTSDGQEFPADMNGSGNDLTIPSVLVGRALGDTLRDAVGTAGLTATLRRDPTRRQVTDDDGRPLLHTPSTYQPGSSVSHFDPSSSPNLLMEPVINGDLDDDLDLTVAVLRDLGWAPDQDLDRVVDDDDNCPAVANENQSDTDSDGLGDACDSTPGQSDSDADGVPNGTDNCVNAPNPQQENRDGDAQGDACDGDDDGDGVSDASDNCDLVANADQTDADGDNVGDACDDSIDTTDDTSDGGGTDPADTDDGGSGFCAVSPPGAPARHARAAVVVFLLSVLFAALAMTRRRPQRSAP